MILPFRCNDTQRLFAGEDVARFVNFRTVAERKLQMLHSAKDLKDLRVPPANRLERLHGDRAGQWSIRIDAQWRLCFRFENGAADGVEIVDHHT